MTQPKNVEIHFNFETGKITIDDDFRCNNGIPMNVYHGLSAIRVIAQYAEVVDSNEADKLISDEDRKTFAELCEKHFETDWDGSNMKGVWHGTPLENFIANLCAELAEEIENCQRYPKPVSGLGFYVEAPDYCEKTHYIDSGMSACSTDKDCEKIAEELAEEALKEFGWVLNGLENDVIYWRDKMREEIEERIVYVLTNGADSTFREEYSDLDDALDAAMEIAREMVGNDSDLDQWGDDMATGWGVCPENDDGAFWPSVHAELDGKRIDKLPWK